MQGSKESAAIAAYTSGGFWPGKPWDHMIFPMQIHAFVWGHFVENHVKWPQYDSMEYKD
jgi:hypothetical protein